MSGKGRKNERIS